MQEKGLEWNWDLSKKGVQLLAISAVQFQSGLIYLWKIFLSSVKYMMFYSLTEFKLVDPRLYHLSPLTLFLGHNGWWRLRVIFCMPTQNGINVFVPSKLIFSLEEPLTFVCKLSTLKSDKAIRQEMSAFGEVPNCCCLCCFRSISRCTKLLGVERIHRYIQGLLIWSELKSSWFSQLSSQRFSTSKLYT